MLLDYKPPRKPSFGRTRRFWRNLLLLLVPAILLTFYFLWETPLPSSTDPTEDLALLPQEQGDPSPPDEPEPPPEIERRVVEGTVKPGDTVTALLGEYFTPGEILELSGKSRKVFPLSGICAGQPYQICLSGDAFESFTYDIDRNHQLIVRRGEEGFDISRVPIPYTVEVRQVRGTIRTSLFDAVSQIGEDAELAVVLADIFAWDIDFIRDIREGDTFQALVEKRFRDGKPAGYGQILAAEFTNQGNNYQAFLFQDGSRPPSYYDAEGKSVRKAFLKAPLSFTRISSGFSRKRFHPVTKTWKAHPAIDYAAPTGTPIKTVGDGTISRIGYTKYNGNFIKIRHNSSYETLYLHMKGFAKGMKQGKRVTQGQVIGYVGSTGLATGPHLCFRMYHNGSPVNPYKVKTPAANPVSPERLDEYRNLVVGLQEQLRDGIIQQARADQDPEDTVIQ